jgi:alpha-galactosidase
MKQRSMLRRPETIPNVPTKLNRLGLVLLCVIACSPISRGERVRKTHDLTAVLTTTDESLTLMAGSRSPKLVSLSGHAGSVWRNEAEEVLPSSVDINGAPVAVTWSFMPDLVSVDAHHVVFEYESAQPHLRLRWQWEARASFGPIEHRITVENLSGQEIWLPLVDSLSLDWHGLPDVALRHFYVEKGADTPSAKGTHLEPVGDGYQWMGRSTTYAHSVDGEGREIIPIEFVYGAATPQAGWYAGIEFSGRTRITLQRNSRSLQSKLGLNPELGPFRTRIPPNSSFELLRYSWALLPVARMALAISCDPGSARC